MMRVTYRPSPRPRGEGLAPKSLALGLALLCLSLLPARLGAGPSAPQAGAPALAIVEPYWEGIEDRAGQEALVAAWGSALDLVQSDLSGRQRILLTDYSLKGLSGSEPRIRVSLTGQAGAWSAVLNLEGMPSSAQASATMKYLSFPAVTADLPLELARAVEYLARQLEPAAARAAATLVDSFSPSELVGVDLPAAASNLAPLALAGRPDGTLAVACGGAILELDRRWEVVGIPGKSLSEAGEYGFAFGLAITPSGTLYARSADGAGIVAFAEGQSEGRRLRVESPPGSAFGVTSAGSPFVVSAQPRMARVWEGRRTVDLALPGDSIVYAASAGPDDTLWLADAAKGSILVLSADGLLRDIVHPDLPAGQPVMRLRVLGDGSFLAATMSGIARFDRQGRALWSWDGRAEGLVPSFSALTDLVAAGKGIVYVNDYAARRIYRLAEPGAALPPDLARVAAASRAVRGAQGGTAGTATGTPASPAAGPATGGTGGTGSGSAQSAPEGQALLALADAYAAMGAAEAERATLALYLEDRPADTRAAGRELRIESALLGARAEAAAKDAAALIARYGPETARPAWTRALRVYEGLRARTPDDRALEARMSALRKLMRDAEGGAEAPAAVLPEVGATELSALFPSMLQAYRSRPVGSVTLRNTTGEALRDVRADLFIPKYMDFASEGKPLGRVEAGAEASLPLSALLNERVLEVEEDLPLQALITLRFTDSRGRRSLEFTRPVTLYRRTALTWAETGRLASFITPNEDTVSRSAFEMIEAPSGATLVSPAVQRAAAICDSVGAIPLRYVQDPVSAFQAVSGDAAAIDTVRFPRTTLAYRAGDCDDSTALLCSLLEAAGIATAILTSPGHVFLAFDSGERAESSWLLEAPGFETVASGGRLWIPVESTALSGGFAASWKAASALVAKYRDTRDFEFMTVQSLRPTFPALPLPPSALPAPLAGRAARDALGALSAAALLKEVYGPAAARLGTAAAVARGADWDRLANRLAQLHARFGRPDLAKEKLRDIVRRDPAYAPAWLNLAGLDLAEGDREGAVAVLRDASRALPSSTALGDFARKAGLSEALASGGVRLATTPEDASAGKDRTRASGGPALEWAGD